MIRIIYADLLFLLNLFSDSVVLYLTGLFSGTGLKLVPMLISSLIGAFIGTLVLCLDIPAFITAISVVTTPILLCFTAFGKRKPSSIGILVFYFYFSSVLLYGGVYAMTSIMHMLFSFSDASLKALPAFLIIGAVTVIYLIFSSLCRRGVQKGGGYVKAELSDGIKSYNLTLLTDSGNLAKDPFSARPVVIVSAASLDTELVNAVCDADTLPKESLYSHIRPRVIPIRTVNGTTLLYAFLPENLYILRDRKKHKANCIIAIDNRSNPFFGKDGIIPSALVQML